jgi:hypothetical protein
MAESEDLQRPVLAVSRFEKIKKRTFYLIPLTGS